MAFESVLGSVVDSASPIDGLPLTGYGHSGLYVGLGAPGTVYPYCSVNYFERLARRMRSQSGVPGNNYGIIGATGSDVASFAFGTFTKDTRKALAVAGTWTPAAYPSGVVVLDLVGNSSHNDSAKMRAGFQNGLDALIRRIRSASLLQDTNGAFVFGGSGGSHWSTLANAYLPGGNEHYTTTPNDTCTITTPAGTDFDLIVNGVDDAALGSVGSAFTVTVDGGAPIAGTVSNQFIASVGALIGSVSSVPLAVPLRGLSNAVHTVVLKHTGSAGQILTVSQLLKATSTPPTIVVVKAAESSSAGYTASGGSWVTDQVYNGYVDTIVSRFGTDQSVVAWDPNTNGWDPGTMVSSVDTSGHIHSNDLGMAACYADGILSLLESLPPRAGLQII